MNVVISGHDFCSNSRNYSDCLIIIMELIRIFKSSIIGRRRCRNNRLGISFTL